MNSSKQDEDWGRSMVYMAAQTPTTKITLNQWEEFNQALTLYLLEGQRVGQAFCNHFGITASPLFYFTDSELSLKWIRNNYL